MSDAAIVVDDVSKRFRLYHERNQSLKAAVMRKGRAKYTELQALDHVSFEVPKGRTFGIIGHNGSGKSTMLKCLARILRPDSGTVTTFGKVSALLKQLESRAISPHTAAVQLLRELNLGGQS